MLITKDQKLYFLALKHAKNKPVSPEPGYYVRNDGQIFKIDSHHNFYGLTRNHEENFWVYDPGYQKYFSEETANSIIELTDDLVDKFNLKDIFREEEYSYDAMKKIAEKDSFLNLMNHCDDDVMSKELHNILKKADFEFSFFRDNTVNSEEDTLRGLPFYFIAQKLNTIKRFGIINTYTGRSKKKNQNRYFIIEPTIIDRSHCLIIYLQEFMANGDIPELFLIYPPEDFKNSK